MATTSGNVGIGNSSPTYKLDVTVDAANFVATSSSATSTFAGGLALTGANSSLATATSSTPFFGGAGPAL